MTALVQYRGAQLVVAGTYSPWTGDVGLAIYLGTASRAASFPDDRRVLTRTQRLPIRPAALAGAGSGLFTRRRDVNRFLPRAILPGICRDHQRLKPFNPPRPPILGLSNQPPCPGRRRRHLVETLMAARQYPQAQALLQEWLEQQPQDSQMWHQLGRVCVELGETQSAIGMSSRRSRSTPTMR